MFDWEIAIAAIIGKCAPYVTATEPLDYVAGFTVAIDLWSRDFKRAPEQFCKFDWVAARASDTGCPIGA